MKNLNNAAVVTAAIAGVSALTPMSAAAAEGGGAGLFSVNPGLIVWTVLVFGALLFVLGRYAWGPLLGALNQREQGIRSAIEEANRLKEESELLVSEHRAQLAEARREAQLIVAESREAAQNVRREIEEKAREEGRAILERAKREIEQEKVAAIESLRRESVELALSAASRLIDKNLDSDADRELVLGYVDAVAAKRGAEA
jgi:F-type H+-transporting ATPase subunit b